LKKTAFWDIVPCNLGEVDDVSEVLAASIIIALIMQIVRTSETSVYFETTRALSQKAVFFRLAAVKTKNLKTLTYYKSTDTLADCKEHIRFQKLIVTQLVHKFISSYGTRSFITVCTRILHRSLL
jgi:hypothetical protein